MIDNTRLVLLLVAVAFAIAFWLAEVRRRHWKSAHFNLLDQYTTLSRTNDHVSDSRDTMRASRDKWRCLAIGLQTEKLEEWEKDR